MAKDRETRIPEDNGYDVPEGWEPDGEGFTVSAEQPDSLFQAVADATTILRHIGGVVQIAPVRRELAPGVFVTVEYAFRWNSYAPPVRDEVAPEAQPEVAEQAA
jgi:hypothetical protein